MKEKKIEKNNFERESTRKYSKKKETKPVQEERKEFFERQFNKDEIEKKLEEEYEKMEADPEVLEKELKEEERQIESLKKEGKLSRLLNIAQKKGVSFAVAVAKDMKNPYILDALHDILARRGFYNKFMK